MVGSNQTGTITIDPAAGLLMTSAQWSVAEFSDVDTSGTNGSSAVAQSVDVDSGGGVTTIAASLASFGHADNRPYMCGGGRIVIADQDFTPTGATEIHDLTTGEGEQLFSMWDGASADTTPTVTWTNADRVAGVAVEIKSSTAVVTGASGILRSRSQ